MSEMQRNKTRKKFQKALLQLCGEKNYFSITVDEICHLADMQRSSFYRYYENKDMLIREIEEETLEAQKNLTDFEYFYSKKDYAANKKIYEEYLRKVFLYIENNRSLYRILLLQNIDPHFEYKIVSSISNGYKKILAGNDLAFAGREDYVSEFFTSGFIAMIRRFAASDLSFSEIESTVNRLLIEEPLENLTDTRS